MRFTVLTPTYNRANYLWDLFHSLQRQTFRDFEWVIVDDGSTDNTAEVIAQMQGNEHSFPIIYKKKTNGGKHRAWNYGINLASGELIFGCDSDDYLTDDALEVTDKVEKTILSDKKAFFAGVCGLRGYRNGDEVGNSFQYQDVLDMTYLERLQNNILGDKAEVLYRSVWKEYKYDEFEGEDFLTEATALMRMAEAGLKIRFFNTIIKTIEYLPDGLSANAKKCFVKNPQGWGLYIHQRIKYGMLSGQGKRDVILDYYDCCRARLRIPKMAKYLHMSTAELGIIVYWNKFRNRFQKWF